MTFGQPRGHRLSSGRWPVVAFVAAVVAAVLLPAAPAAPDVPSGGPLERVGRLDRWPKDAIDRLGPSIEPAPGNTTLRLFSGTLIMLAEARQLWQLFPSGSPGTGEPTRVAVRSLDTPALEIVSDFTLDFVPLRPLQAGSGGEWIHAGDEKQRVFLPYEVRGSGCSLCHHVAVVDTRSLQVTRRYLLADFADQVGGLVKLGGLTYDPYGDALWALYGVAGGFSAASSYNTFLIRLDLKTGERSRLRPVRSCSGESPAAATFSLAVPVFIPSPEFLYVTCHVSGYPIAVVRLERAAATDPGSSEEPVIGPAYLETALGDSASARLFLLTNAGEVWVFDTRAMAFVGVVAASVSGPQGLTGFGADPASGRVFFLSRSHGVGVIEGRFFPVPQARTFPGHKAVGQERIWSDARTGLVFVLDGSTGGGGGRKDEHDHYVVYRQDPAPVPPPPPDPDASTVDVEEREGVTEARYFASANGYGARVLLAGGLAAVTPAPSLGGLNPVAENYKQGGPKCRFTDRELVAGWVAKAEYDATSTAAEAVAVGIDPRTRIDLERPSRCDVQGGGFDGIFSTPLGPALSGVVDQDSSDPPRWNRDPAVCTASGGGKGVSAQGNDHGAPPFGASRVTCPEPGGELGAHAEAPLSGQVGVTRAWTDVKITRDAAGVHVRVEAVAQGVDLLGRASIAEIRSVAESGANGRPRDDAMSSQVVTISGLSVDGKPVCGACDPRRVVDVLNQVLLGKAEFHIGESGLDQALVEGTPGGALTAVKKSEKRQVSDRSLMGDFTTEVPGLEAITYNDNNFWGRARALYQFAGVSTVANYTIVRLPPFSPLADLASLELPPRPGVSGVRGLAPEASAVGGAPGEDTTVLLASDSDESAGRGDASAPGFLEKARDALEGVWDLFLRHPREALLVLTGWALLGLPGLLASRRRLLGGIPGG